MRASWRTTRKSTRRRRADFLRLEIESRKDRDYEWIVHHVDRPAKLEDYKEVRQTRDGCAQAAGFTTLLHEIFSSVLPRTPARIESSTFILNFYLPSFCFKYSSYSFFNAGRVGLG